jgi:hypothetical protein
VRSCSRPSSEWCFDGVPRKRSTTVSNKSNFPIATMGIDSASTRLMSVSGDA